MKNILFIIIILSFRGYGQEQCHYPFDQSADSLVSFVISESGSDGEFKSRPSLRKAYKDPNHNAAFRDCINDLKMKIGDSLFCSNVTMHSMFSFDQKTSFTNVFTLTFQYKIPIINEPILVTYVYNSDINGKAEVLEHPRNLPTLSLSEINIKKEKVIEILKSRNILKEKDDVYMNVSGNYWNVTLTSDHFNYRKVSVNIKTGDLSRISYRDNLDGD